FRSDMPVSPYLSRRRWPHAAARCAAIALLATAFAAALPTGARAAVSVVDDAGQTITLAQPARRIVSLAPHVTEMLFAAGGGERIVGTVNYSDYPPE
ncbi:hypothetical protein ABTD55_20715, partial [Acinetobacter baumannii]